MIHFHINIAINRERHPNIKMTDKKKKKKHWVPTLCLKNKIKHHRDTPGSK